METLSLAAPFQKPQGCASCGYRTTGSGFVPTFVGVDPRVAFLLEAPGQEEAYERELMSGAAGKWFLKRFIEPLGYTRSNCIFASVIGCRPPEGFYPTAGLRSEAETSCRQYEGFQGRRSGGLVQLESGGLDKWNPDLYVVTYAPGFIFKSWSLLRVLANDIEKAFRFAEQGFRPLVLMGDKALEKILPNVQVGPSKYRGTFGKLDWKGYKEGRI